jgi:hypothetical protein
MPAGPTWWERASTVLLENWTGILGAVVLVTGVGFLGIYAALRVSPQLRFLMICAFAAGLLGARVALRDKAFAKKLNAWLTSSAAAIFLFACVGAVSIAGLRWVTAPFDQLLLLAGVSANLYLAWRTSRQEVATLHGVLSLVALAVLPPAALTLGAAAGVTAFSIAITYRQLWKYQLLLSIVSFFVFHLYWHQSLPALPNALRLTAMALVLLVGGAAAVVQYRRVYAQRRFEPLLFTAHLLNWTCLGINLYLYSTGSAWKTIPLGLGAILTFWAGRRAKQLGIGWLFQTDTIISLILALATALSLQGWHTTPTVIGLFMLLEALLITLVTARQGELLVYRVALTVASLASLGLLVVASGHLVSSPPASLYREALVLALAGWAGLAFVQFILKQRLLRGATPEQDLGTEYQSPRYLLNLFAGLTGLLQLGAGLALARILFSWSTAPIGLLLGLAAAALALATWVRRAGRAPSWVRWQQLVLAQLFVLLALVGLHEVGLMWSVVLLLVYAETLTVALLLAGRAAGDALHRQLYRAALAEAVVAALAVLLRAASLLPHSEPTVLYSEILLVALAGWGSIAFAQAAFRWPRLAAVKPYLPQFLGGDSTALTNLVSNPEEHRSLVNCFAGLGGVLQVVAGIGLSRVLFGPTATWLVLGLIVALGAISIGLATWVRTAGRLPGWARWQQLVLAQGLVALALVGLHEVGLSWSGVGLLLLGENLLVVLLLAGRAAFDHLHTLVYRAALAQALGTGVGLLLVAASHLASAGLVVLYRDALVLALAGWAALGFVQAAVKWPLLRGVRPYLPGYAAADLDASFSTELVSNPEAHLDLLHSFAGLAGVLQAGAGLVLIRLVFGWAGAPVAWLLGALGLLAGATLGLGLWLRATPALPKWMRRQQVVLAQSFAVIAILGLHRLGLSWPGVLSVLYAESLVVALLLSGRDEDDLLHVQTYLLVVQALLLPLLVRYTSLGALGPWGRAALLVGAALLTLGYQLRRFYWRRAQEDFARLTLGAGTPLPALGVAVGWLLLGAGALVVGQQWAAWPAMALLGALLYLRQRVALPGLWAGLMLAGMGYLGLQWHHVLLPIFTHGARYSTGYVLLYLLPTLAVPVAGLLTSWWAAGQRYVRWPWLYLLGAHLGVALLVAVPAGHVAYLMLGLLALGGAAFGAALAWRRALPDAAAVVRAGLPDRYLLHLGYGGLLGSLLLQGWLVAHHEVLFGLRADYVTAGLFVVLVSTLALARPPATEPVYASWQQLHPWLPEVALLFGSVTLLHEVRTPWLPLVWVAVALLLGGAAPRLALRFRRLGLYGRLYYWLAAVTASACCLRYITPAQLLSADWWALTAAVLLLFGYVTLALRQSQALFAQLSPAWGILALPARHRLESWLLYPAFVALAVLLIQSFDRSVLTVLLMLQVVAVFGGSLALRRQDLRYVALAGLLGCMARLLFFDLRQSGTVTRAIVFIIMGLLLLGMNALYARFKSRFEPEPAEQLDLGEDDLVVDTE